MFFGGQERLGLSDQLRLLRTWSSAEYVHDGQVQPRAPKVGVAT